MKRSIYLLLVVSGYCYGQHNEFQTYPNGLIYDETTMYKLGVIVDSLNIRFRSCDLSHPYYAFPQGMASLVSIPPEAILRFVEGKISFEEFEKEFPQHIINKNIWVIKSKFTDYNEEKRIKYSGLPYGWSNEPSISVQDRPDNDKTTGWIIDEKRKKAIYLDKLNALELPYSYARLVQYVDCMIDTATQIYFPGVEPEDFFTEVNRNQKAEQFINWANKFPGEPGFPSDKKLSGKNANKVYEHYAKEYAKWDSIRLLNLDDQMKKSHYWRNLLMEARDEALDTGDSDKRLEFYIARYLSKEDALKLKRGRKVMGMCSQDQSPRFHAMSICQLAAETIQWDIFLRSHLDIMNDRFERASDGSYAWAGRKTYLKELEELDIQAVDLLLGTCLQVQNVSDNHYWGSVSRVGRALSDVVNKDKLELQLIAMIQDEKLDPYNRLLLAYMFDHYAHNLEDENRRTINQQKLKEAIDGMPLFIKEVWGKE